MSGKGSGRRPQSVSDQEYADNWSRTFARSAPWVAHPDEWRKVDLTDDGQPNPFSTEGMTPEQKSEVLNQTFGEARMPEDRVETDSESRRTIPAWASFEYITLDEALKREPMPLDFGNEDES